MVCRHRGSYLPSGLYVPCACPESLEYHRRLHDWEEAIAETVGDLLALGWMPTMIVDEVRSRTPRSSRAWMLVRVEFACLGGSWLVLPERASHLAQAGELAKYTGFHVGSATPGWLGRWIATRAMHDASVAKRAVLHLLDAVDPILEAAAADLDLSDWPELAERRASIPTVADVQFAAAAARLREQRSSHAIDRGSRWDDDGRWHDDRCDDDRWDDTSWWIDDRDQSRPATMTRATDNVIPFPARGAR